ncbi:MAG: hypothetical protein A2725_01395 [Candidatus Magasanikbacteria bacterium RIFCSPHIGHO2_01_FULL_33_34]|uniref:Uncharacterized protein n=1 Tax=Candidatus Magasanikbacteria bacterium RIFCSPHIGHO2_01_FULL_33_34 TaxID=1798671 RepID=A0A1F6LJJ7_9BACT|nr:MAG: hypothetical protein A2725_01395 [Candidatus Magasanikbacteria bacterium RIFCSPHIGHO2_01_FULL_33_34]OGH65472.1 MAG: hypothetical protein A3B83_01150 [Candidatus Magasanikbacteria bacterium RIFCSPHIGHO2_02_FULL_33_17]OGH76182.1 MAG: hypothetical protein A3A89_01970 [Candidatus Magasanikbacteria bacterium RIFCSPLOWO2_01_FULL_33_34]
MEKNSAHNLNILRGEIVDLLNKFGSLVEFKSLLELAIVDSVHGEKVSLEDIESIQKRFISVREIVEKKDFRILRQKIIEFMEAYMEILQAKGLTKAQFEIFVVIIEQAEKDFPKNRKE